MSDLHIQVEKVDWHRNGIGGAGFYVCLFTFVDDGRTRKALGVLFGDGEDVKRDRGYCAVFDRDLLAKDIIGMFESPGNAWRGDEFEGELRRQVKEIMAEYRKREPFGAGPAVRAKS